MVLFAQDNPYAKRINRTIKEKYLDHWKPSSFDPLRKDVKRAVDQYNNKGPHDNLYKRNPVEYENYWFKLSIMIGPRIRSSENKLIAGCLYVF
jgi:hypothetical protein